MTPVETATPFKARDWFFENFQAPVWDSTIRVWYFLSATGVWLSTHMQHFTFGRNASGVFGFLRTINGVLTSATHGPMCMTAGKVVYFSGINLNASLPDPGVKLWNEGTDKGVIVPAFNGNRVEALDIDVVQGTLALEIPLGGSTGHNRPMYTIGVRWSTP
jgi:hypothetical protein